MSFTSAWKRRDNCANCILSHRRQKQDVSGFFVQSERGVDHPCELCGVHFSFWNAIIWIILRFGRHSIIILQLSSKKKCPLNLNRNSHSSKICLSFSCNLISCDRSSKTQGGNQRSQDTDVMVFWMRLCGHTLLCPRCSHRGRLRCLPHRRTTPGSRLLWGAPSPRPQTCRWIHTGSLKEERDRAR